ncbi:hypothetical protein [Emticicia sp. C21]|uniref:hypothetical protein n=1 Tax=Emticicia sp. C21 TaxID=2302915 RepID=UPI000E35573F|nr:hypothetical protein [Emticicia sp. C21]RFS18392.1 hypothetical protein D0T08_03850 [Emticicia sp. C21]
MDKHRPFEIAKTLNSFSNEYFVEILFDDKRKENLGHVLTMTSVIDIEMLYSKIFAFKESANKIDFANKHFNGYWEDHPFPNPIVLYWGGMDTTKNNLGVLVNLIAYEFGPTIVYSITLDKVFVVEELWHIISEINRIPEIFEMTLDELIEILQWWAKIVEELKNTPDMLL